MKIALLILASSLGCFAQTFDVYGGWQQSTCSGGTAAHFYTEKVANRWWLCTPSGNHLFFQGVGGTFLSQLAINPVTKYGSNANWAAQQVNFFKSLHFNAVGEISEPILFATTNSNKVPFIETVETSVYATTNLLSLGTHPVKNFIYGVNAYFNNYRGAGCIDAFDTGYPTFANGYFANGPGVAAEFSSPYFIGAMIDDTDFVCGFGAGPDNNTTPSGIIKANLAFIAMVSSPVQVFNNGFTYQSTPVQYSDSKVYTKTAMASPPTTCAITTPCTLRTYLSKKYGTIGALNTAWGTSSYYTTFDSAGTVVTSESCGTGNGVTTVFTCTLAHGSISPLSVSVSTAGTLQGGDCPWTESRCNVNGQLTTPYICGTVGNCIGSFGGAAGTNLSSGTAPPWLQGFSETDCGGCGLPPASYWVRTAWHGCPSPTPSREVGNSYGSGAPQITVDAQNNANDKPACATGLDIYVSCEVFSGGASHGCVAAGSSQPVETLQATNIAYPLGSWTEPTGGLVAGAALPSSGNSIDYGSGAVQLTFTTAPANGQAITLGYTYGGWMFGSGLMDEDGRHTSWVGTNAGCLTGTVHGGPGTTGFDCDGVIFPVANMNQTMAADLEAWQSQYAGRYFSTMRSALKASWPSALYLGNDTLGDWDAPPRSQILQGASPYLDLMFWVWFSNQSDDSAALAKYSYVSRYLGDIPLLNFSALHAQPDSAFAGNSNSDCCFGLTTQPLRAQQWTTMLTRELNTLSYNNSYQFVGAVWWGLYDFTNEGISWGLKTPSDNAYNAHDAVSGTVACAPPLTGFTCGSEPAPSSPGVRPFGDLMAGLTTANALWYASPSAPCLIFPNGWCNTGLSAVQDNLLGPLIPVGSSPWVYGDLMEKAVIDTMAPAALLEAPVLGAALSGTVSWTSGANTITTTTSQVAAISAGVYIALAWSSVDGAGTGRAICNVRTVTSTTITCQSNIFAPTSSGITAYRMSAAAGPSGFTFLGWDPQNGSNVSTTWNYYDTALAIYRYHYRLSGDTTYLAYARAYADIQWQWTLDHGYGYQAPRAEAMISQYFRALDGHSERLPYLYNITQQSITSFGSSAQFCPYCDLREVGYALWSAALGAKTDTDITRHANYCSALTTYVPYMNSAQQSDGSWGEREYALNASFVDAPLSYTAIPPFVFQGAPWRQSIDIKMMQAAYESLVDTSTQGCNRPTLAATTLTTITNAITWQRNYGRDSVGRGTSYEVNSQSWDQATVVNPGGTVSIALGSNVLTGVGTTFITSGMNSSRPFVGIQGPNDPRTVYKVLSCSSNTSCLLTVNFGIFGESQNVVAQQYSIAPPAFTNCNSSATYCGQDPNDRNLNRTICGGMGWLYAHTLNATYQGWLNECLSATLGGPTAGPTSADVVLGTTLPCSGPACDGYITDTGVAMRNCSASGGVAPCQNFTQIGNLGKNFGEAFGAPGIDNGLAWRLLGAGPVAPTITTSSPITSGTINVAYSFQFAANGTTPITWSGTGLPSWASLSSGGLLTGTPNATGTTVMAISASNAGGTAGPTSFSLTIAGIVPTITSTSPLPGGTNGTPYSFQFTASGSTPITWGATGLPGWASLSSAGLLTGTPNANGTTVIAVTATNATGNSGPHNFSITVIAGSVAPTITSTSPLPNAPLGVAYSFQFSANGTAPITWGATGLPTWASYSVGGLLTGTPDAIGISTLHITATNGTGSDGPDTFSLTVPGVSPTITTSTPLPGGTFGVAYSLQFAATGTTPITWSSSGLPGWASLSSGGLLTGTPNASGTSSFTVTATNATGSDGPDSFTLAIAPPATVAPTITSTSPLPAGLIGSPYSFQFTATGTTPITWSGTGFPTWASFSSTGLLTGTPNFATTSPLSITATNTAGSAGPTVFSLVVTGAAPIPTCSPQTHVTPPNVTDSRLQTNMALALVACTNSLTQTGTCTVVDVRRVNNAILGAACLIGP